MRIDADFSFTQPSGDQLVAAGIGGVRWYCGPARPSIASIQDWDAHGLAQVSILERTSDRAESSGYAGGVEDARYWLARTNEVRPGTAAAFVMSDGSSGSPSGGLPGTQEYSRGVGDILGFSFEGYGNEDAVAAAMRGSGHCTVDWIPETWTSRQGTGVRQLVGGVPIPGIDLNHAFVTVGQPAAAQPKGANKDMWIASRVTAGKIECMWVGGNMWVGDVGGGPGAYGFPTDAVAAQSRGVEIHPVDPDTWGRLITNAQMVTGLAALAAAGPQAGGGSSLTPAQLTAAVKAGVHGVPVTGILG